MTIRTLLAVGAMALGLSVATAAAAHGIGGFICQTSNISKGAPPMTHCVTWTKEAAKRMREAPCDPSKMSAAEMRQRCAEMSAAATTPSNG
jgi:hypothetical protein